MLWCVVVNTQASYTEGWIRLREMSDGEEDVLDITQSPKCKVPCKELFNVVKEKPNWES